MTETWVWWLVSVAASQKLAPSGWANGAAGDSVAFPAAGQDWSREWSGVTSSAATPAVNNNNFIKRGSDIYKEEKKKISTMHLDGQSADGSDI